VAALGALSQESHPLLHSLVFGEAVVNDATAIVLVRAVQHVRGHAALSGATLAAMLANFARLFALR
jgi:sodium/hydrogen exchanger 8